MAHRGAMGLGPGAASLARGSRAARATPTCALLVAPAAQAARGMMGGRPLASHQRHPHRLPPAAPARHPAASAPGRPFQVSAVQAPYAPPPPPTYPDRPDLFGTPRPGSPEPLGATLVSGDATSVNFAVYSSTATACALCLFTDDDLNIGLPTVEIALDPFIHRSGAVWHIELPALSPALTYGWRMSGAAGSRHDAAKVLLDPYAKSVVGRSVYGKPGRANDCWPQVAGSIPSANDVFDWQGDKSPDVPLQDQVIYECHVRGFTADPSSGVSHPGTYRGLIEKLPHLKEMGVTSIELLPVHEFNELEYYGPNPASPGDFRYNFWGYSTVNFFSPMMRYAASAGEDHGRAAIREFKEMVRACHREGIEVILDVVFNHTAEGNEMGPTVSFRGLDDRAYYMVAPRGEYYNYSGCGNTLNVNHPVTRRMILDSLRYWVTEMHVDGFRFDLAAIFVRSSDLWEEAAAYGEPLGIAEPVSLGTPLGAPPLVEAIANDPVLRSVKLIAEPWDCGGLYLVGAFPSWGVWAEWNGKFRDSVRTFVRGADGAAGEFAACLAGSPEVYRPGGRAPFHGINFITAHDGFSMADLVSYNGKHNLANGEQNNDGEEHNSSWNCGAEGPSDDPGVVRLRRRQMRNLAVALLAAQGVPMILMGDEYGHTKGGNNNTYCHDSPLNWFDWDRMREDRGGYGRFLRQLIALRKRLPQLGQAQFMTGDQLEWHGAYGPEVDWEGGKFVGMLVKHPEGNGNDLYVAFNAGHEPVFAQLPATWHTTHGANTWRELINTARPAPYDAMGADVAHEVRAASQLDASRPLADGLLPMLPYSAAVLEAIPEWDSPGRWP